MKGRSTLVLLVCIVVLGAFIGIQEWRRGRDSSREIQRIKLFDIDPATLTAMQFAHSNSVIDCVKENGAWMVGEPGQRMSRADEALVYGMVSGINSMGKGTTITARQMELRGHSAAEYGFEPPATVIRASDGRGRRSWLVGRAKPLSEEIYVMEAAGEEIYTVPDALLGFIPEAADQLRDRVLFPGVAAGIRRVELRGSTGFIRIVKESGSGWRIVQPLSAPADPLEMDAFIGVLCRIRIDDFVADDVSDWSVYGLQGETEQISLGGLDGTARMLELGDPIPDRPGFVYARRADDTSVFTLREDVLRLLEVPVDRFRDARVLSLPKDEIDSVRIRRNSETLTMSRDASGSWQMSTPVVWGADADAVGNLIGLWDAAVITEFNVETNTRASEWVFEFGSSQSGLTNRIEVLSAAGGKDGLLIRRDGETSLFQINLPEVSESAIDPLVYKDRRIWALDRNAVNKLILRKNGQERQTVELLDDGSFVLAGAAGRRSLDAVALERMVEELVDIETSGYIAYNPENLEIYGLEPPALELHVGFSGTNELGRVLLIGNEATKGFYSMVKGRDVVFYLDRKTVNALSADLAAKPKETVPSTE